MARKRGLEAQAFLAEENKRSKTEHPPNLFDQFESREEINEKIKSKYENFEDIYKSVTDEDIVWEYSTFLKTLPTTVSSRARNKLINEVKSILKMDEVTKRLEGKTDEEKTFSETTLETSVLDAVSALLGTSLKIIAPPTSSCVYCKKKLTEHNEPNHVQLHTRTGTKIALKYILRCRQCKEAQQNSGNMFGSTNNINYHPTRYGNNVCGYKEYSDAYNAREVRATDAAFVEDIFAKQYFAEFHHGWLSSQAKTEAYNETNRGTQQEERTLQFLKLNPEVGFRFKEQNKVGEDEKDETDDEDEETGSKNEENNERKTRMHEMKRKTLSQALINNEIKSELREKDKLDTTKLGPLQSENNNITFKKSRYNLMKDINEDRKKELYIHKTCHSGCQKRGCNKITTFDGLWKIQFQICMWDSSSEYPKEITEFVPQVCPEEPEHGSAFCSVHTNAVKDLKLPTNVKEFIKSCGADPEKFTKEGKAIVDNVAGSTGTCRHLEE